MEIEKISLVLQMLIKINIQQIQTIYKCSFEYMVKMHKKVVKEFNFEQMQFKKIAKQIDYIELEEIAGNIEVHTIKYIDINKKDNSNKEIKIALEEKSGEVHLFSPKLPQTSD